ncbi:hypothetical protein [Proteus vulgaris]|uniref:hypothetical protein n=1 Tax=Proteus vulgaris TaxID=585 RepID=UPI0032DB8C70
MMLECLALEDACVQTVWNWIYENWSWGFFIAVVSLFFTTRALKKTDKSNELAEISLSITRKSLEQTEYSINIAESDYNRIRTLYALDEARQKYKYTLIKQILQVKLLWYKNFLTEMKDSLSSMKQCFSSDTLINFVKSENFTAIVFLNHNSFLLRNKINFSFDELSELINIDIHHNKDLSIKIADLEINNEVLNYHLSMHISFVEQRIMRESSIDIETININIDLITNHLYKTATNIIKDIRTKLD